MSPWLLKILCDPVDHSDLRLDDAVYDSSGNIESGLLISSSQREYLISGGVPRFVENRDKQDTVDSFGHEWNFFNFSDFKLSWLTHTIRNTFGSTDVFCGKVVVDAGAGSGIQSRWIREAGAKHVVALELSHSVDGVIKRNLMELDGVDVVQCSIDRPPIKPGIIDGMVICHNVIQHTESVERTAQALWRLVAPGGEFVFNCYPRNDVGLVRRLRLRLYEALRGFLSRRSFRFLLNYSRVMSLLRFVPLLGNILEKSTFVVRGHVPSGPRFLERCYKAGVLNTFDCYGSHAYQHLKSDSEIRELVAALSPDEVLNEAKYFSRPQPIGVALRLLRHSKPVTAG